MADDELYDEVEIDSNDEDFNVSQYELEKVRMLLKGREEVEMEIPCATIKQKFCKSHQNFRKQEIQKRKVQEQKEREKIDAKHFLCRQIFPIKMNTCTMLEPRTW